MSNGPEGIEVHEARERREKIAGIAKAFIERAKALGLKGKRRDDEAVAYFLGAYALATMDAKRTHDDALAKHIGTVTELCVATRGYSAVERLAAMQD